MSKLHELIDRAIAHCEKLRPAESGHGVTLALLMEIKELAEESRPNWMAMDQPFSIVHILTKLTDAARILLYAKDYDGHGREEIEICYQKAFDIIKEIENKTRSGSESIAKV